MRPALGSDVRTMLLVVEENVLQSNSRLHVVHERIHFEIVFKTSEIHIGRAHGRDVVVYHHRLGMEEP